eukprot:TRINITY_DN1579_c1_g1_i3.p1 TRINITY_DN1579_c1_g1~~TRINITY_DN1579_c1_g1_i3.p1  ORF type:complete len:738 (-),score=182.71 TRINITY_DN1579_c1_g1_i3:45-2258(-)
MESDSDSSSSSSGTGSSGSHRETKKNRQQKGRGGDSGSSAHLLVVESEEAKKKHKHDRLKRKHKIERISEQLEHPHVLNLDADDKQRLKDVRHSEKKQLKHEDVPPPFTVKSGEAKSIAKENPEGVSVIDVDRLLPQNIFEADSDDEKEDPDEVRRRSETQEEKQLRDKRMSRQLNKYKHSHPHSPSNKPVPLYDSSDSDFSESEPQRDKNGIDGNGDLYETETDEEDDSDLYTDDESDVGAKETEKLPNDRRSRKKRRKQAKIDRKVSKAESKRKKKQQKKQIDPKKYYTHWEDPAARHDEDIEYFEMLLEIERKIRDPEQGIKIKTLRPKYKKLKEFHHVFSGLAAKRWFLEQGYATNNREARYLGTALMSRKVIYDLDNKVKFRLQRYALYRFFEDEGRAEEILELVRPKKDGTIALIASPMLFDDSKIALAPLFGISQVAVVDGFEVDTAFVKHYYVEDEPELTAEDIWKHKRERTNKEKLELHESTVMHNGDLNQLKEGGKLYMVAVNGTTSSVYAFDEIVKEMDISKDFIIIVAIRERPLPDILALLARDAPKRVDWEFNVWLTVRHFMEPLRELLMLKKINFIMISPKARQGRSRLVRVAIQYKPNVIALGKHIKGERGEINYPHGRWRSWAPYIANRCKWADVRIYRLDGDMTSSFDKRRAKGQREIRQVSVPAKPRAPPKQKHADPALVEPGLRPARAHADSSSSSSNSSNSSDAEETDATASTDEEK